MKKSVKKVLAALLSVLLFASLFTTTAFAATPGEQAVADAKGALNDAIDNFYSKFGKAWIGLNTDVVYANYMAKLDAVKAAYVAEVAAKNPTLGAILADPSLYGDITAALNVFYATYYGELANYATAAAYESIAAHVEEFTNNYVAAVDAVVAKWMAG